MQDILIRKAEKNDIEAILQIMLEDMIGEKEDYDGNKIHENYIKAFETINRNDWQYLAVAVQNSKVIGTFQLSFIPNIIYTGALICLVEAVLVSSEYRGKGIGSYMMKWAIDTAKEKGCRLVELTSNKLRNDAHRFYKQLGFIATHEGFKLDLK